MTRTIAHTLVTLVTALLLVGALSGGAMAQAVGPPDAADEATTDAPASIYAVNDSENESADDATFRVNEDGESSFTTADEDVSDKESYVEEETGSGDVTTMGSATLSDETTDSAEGDTIKLETEMTADFSSGVTTATFEADGSTSATWLGSSPYNADEIQINSQVGVDGVEVTISYPPSFSKGSGYSATISKSFSDEWNVGHQYSNFEAESHVALYNGYQRDSATFTFDNQAYTIYSSVDTDIV